MTEPRRVHLNRGPDVRSPLIRAVAYHESGHAVIAHLFRVQVADVSIMADAVCLGRVRFRFAIEPWEVAVLVDCAGQAAQNHAQTVGLCSFTPPYNAFDLASARTTIAARREWDLFDPRVDTELDRWRHEAGAAVHHHWTYVARVAEALVARRVLTGDEILGLR